MGRGVSKAGGAGGGGANARVTSIKVTNAEIDKAPFRKMASGVYMMFAGTAVEDGQTVDAVMAGIVPVRTSNTKYYVARTLIAGDDDWDVNNYTRYNTLNEAKAATRQILKNRLQGRT